MSQKFWRYNDIHENEALVEELRMASEREKVRLTLEKIAVSQIGKPYVYGAVGPMQFDCSGLSFYVYNRAGQPLPREMSGQWVKLKPTRRPQKGDLLFFKTTAEKSFVTHVGIYIGNDKFINAPNPQTPVRIDNIDDPYWRSTYVGARSIY